MNQKARVGELECRFLILTRLECFEDGKKGLTVVGFHAVDVLVGLELAKLAAALTSAALGRVICVN